MFSAPFEYQPKNPEYKALVEKKLEGQHFMRHIGFELTKIEPGYIEGQANMQQFMAQQDGMVHGGITATVADIVTGFAAFTMVGKDDRVVTSDLKVSYFAPGKGDILFARGWVIKPGSRLQYCEGEVYVITSDGKPCLIAKSYAIMAVLQDRNKQ